MWSSSVQEGWVCCLESLALRPLSRLLPQQLKLHFLFGHLLYFSMVNSYWCWMNNQLIDYCLILTEGWHQLWKIHNHSWSGMLFRYDIFIFQANQIFHSNFLLSCTVDEFVSEKLWSFIEHLQSRGMVGNHVSYFFFTYFLQLY